MKKPFRGICAVIVTPFKEDGSFDIPAAKSNLDYLIESGIHGICILGATGEYMSLTMEEHKAYVQEVVPYIRDRVTVVVGATRERPDDVIELIRNAKEAGAHSAMVLPSPYCHPSQEEIVAHYRYIGDNTDFPLMVYNNPSSAGVEIEPETFQQIFKLEHTALVKESSGDVRRLTGTRMDAPPDISVLCGCDNLAYESFLAGGDGWVSMLANVAPRDCVALYEAVCEEKDFEKGFEIYRRILPALNFLESFSKPVQSLKYVLTRKGLTGGFVRRPRLELTSDEKRSVESGMHPDEIQ